jgi:hypothetical protein
MCMPGGGGDAYMCMPKAGWTYMSMPGGGGGTRTCASRGGGGHTHALVKGGGAAPPSRHSMRCVYQQRVAVVDTLQCVLEGGQPHV